jgi:hypothetical protein
MTPTDIAKTLLQFSREQRDWMKSRKETVPMFSGLCQMIHDKAMSVGDAKNVVDALMEEGAR